MNFFIHTVLISITLTRCAIPSNIRWVISDIQDSHSVACQKNNLDIYIPTVNAPTWNYYTLKYVVEELLKKNLSANSGIKSCCATGLWCNLNNECSTAGFGDTFSNFGWINNDNYAYPVYTCISENIRAMKYQISINESLSNNS